MPTCPLDLPHHKVWAKLLEIQSKHVQLGINQVDLPYMNSHDGEDDSLEDIQLGGGATPQSPKTIKASGSSQQDGIHMPTSPLEVSILYHDVPADRINND